MNVIRRWITQPNALLRAAALFGAGMALTLAAAVLLFLRRDRLRTEYEYTFTNLQPGEHEVGITVYGNRVNGFGCVHNCDDSTSWFGPDCWRSEGVRWCYEYRLRKSGLLVSPQIEK